MSQFLVQLPARKASMNQLAQLDQKSREAFTTELLEALWDAHETGNLPEGVVQLLRDWIAHAHFEQSPVVGQRIRDARQRGLIT